jgi:hypothetical protein
MIDWLRAAKSAHFYKKRKRIPKAAIAQLFRCIRDRSDAATRNIFSHVKEQHGHSQWSAIAFFYERDPSFLAYPEGHDHTRERICGFLMIVEYREYAVVFKSNLDLPSSFKTEYLQRVGDQNFEAAIAPVDATFEQIRLRNMATSKHTLRSKTLEANNLQNVMGRAGASRYIAQGYRVRQNGEHLSGTPHTGRLSQRSDKAPYRELIAWVEASIETLGEESPVLSPFIQAFARPINLESMPANLSPRYLAIDIPQLSEDVFEYPEEIRFVRGTGDAAAPLDTHDTEVVLAALDQNFLVRKQRDELVVIDPRSNMPIGNISINKSRISLRKLSIPEMADIYVEHVNLPGNENGGIPLKRYIDQNNLFTILFNDLAVVYIDGTLYRDSNLTDGRSFLMHIRAYAQLHAVTSEKGAFAAGQAAFNADSVFGVVIDHIADRRELLVCDDLGDEWADFIGINEDSQPKTFSFYHAKHGAITLGASSLHVAVSQAIKNLGHLNPADDEIATKFEKWEARYTNANVETNIQRIRGDAEEFREKLNNTLLSPDTIRRVFIVTSSLSRRQLQQQFADIQGGNAPSAHFVQLYWLLLSFFSACNEVNANGYVICQE